MRTGSPSVNPYLRPRHKQACFWYSAHLALPSSHRPITCLSARSRAYSLSSYLAPRRHRKAFCPHLVWSSANCPFHNQTRQTSNGPATAPGLEPQLWGLLCLELRLLGTPHPMQPPHKPQQQLNVTSWLLLSPRKGLCAEARAEPHWFKLASAPAQGETLCRNSVRNIETTTTTQTTTPQSYELASALFPERTLCRSSG